MTRKTCTIGIDLGGTNIVFGLVSPSGELLHHFHHPTEGHKGPDQVIENILAGISEILDNHGDYHVNGIGLGSPGAIDTERGVVIQCAPNIPDWTGRQIRQPIVDRFGLPTFVDNDAKMAVIGEATFGAGAGHKNLFVVTLGTGTGGGVVLNGKIHRGSFFCAGEIGHAGVQINGRTCACGQNGHLEAYASAKGLVGQMREAIAGGEHSSVIDSTGGDLEKLTAKTVLDAAQEGDKLAARVVDLSCHYLGMALAHFAMVIDPEMIVISGGIALAGKIIFDPVRKYYEQYLYYKDIRIAPIVPAKLTFEAGMVGAAAMAMIELKLNES
ncbi:MAG: ROK family protein [Gemmatimonadota bacterium]|nr:ROK family protein [Gemmatimonadota bacterium]